MKVNRIWLSVVAAASAAVLAGCGSTGTSAGTTSSTASPAASSVPSSAAPTSSSPAGPTASSTGGASAADAEQYCEQSGGQVQARNPYWNTNGDQSQWLALGGTASVCRFQADDEAKSRIYVDLTTLSSTEPTLAGLAYLSKVPMPAFNGGGNPATGYCSNELHASSTFGGALAAGGGWVNQTDPDDVVVALCVFPDGSFIDEWGLAYHSAGEIRGQDLATVMRYQPAGPLPPVFPTSAATPTS